MSEIPPHTSPQYSVDTRDDALFHYTSAEGLIGILQDKEIWSTAYHCTNDESELSAGSGILTPIFMRATHGMVDENDPLVQTIRARGVSIFEHANRFEQIIVGMLFNRLCAYVTCFCKPAGEEDFRHGLLSQWRAYGVDGGYALQFSRKRLTAAVEKANEAHGLNYNLQDLYYTNENPLKSEVLKHTDAFIRAFKAFLEELGNIEELFRERSISSPIVGLSGGPLESLLEYLIQTKIYTLAKKGNAGSASSNLSHRRRKFSQRTTLIVVVSLSHRRRPRQNPLRCLIASSGYSSDRTRGWVTGSSLFLRWSGGRVLQLECARHTSENGGDKLVHGSGGISQLRAE